VFFVSEIMGNLTLGLDPFHWHMYRLIIKNYPWSVSLNDTTDKLKSFYFCRAMDLYSLGTSRYTGHT